MANVYNKQQIEKSVLQNLLNRYNNIVKSVKIFGENSSNASTESPNLPYASYQSIFQQIVKHNPTAKNPYSITIKDLQKAINYLEDKFSGNCNCYSVQQRCQTCQAQCSADKGVNLG